MPGVGAETLRLASPSGTVTAALDRPPAAPARPPALAAQSRPSERDELGVPVVLTHGAGGDAFGAGLEALARGLAAAGHLVVRFNLPYREAGRASPPAAERSVPGYRAAYDDARARVESGWGRGPGRGERPWAVGGKSYGGRVASIAVAEGMETAALVFYGYPLHPPGRPESLRVDHWPAITVPCLFLQGSHDPFCDLELLRAHLHELGGPATLHVVEGGDHSLQVRGGKAPDGKPRSAGRVLADLAPVVSEWLRSVVPGR